MDVTIAFDGHCRATIGGIEIVRSRPGHVWLTHPGDGEGMECPEAELAEWLERFYRERF